MAVNLQTAVEAKLFGVNLTGIISRTEDDKKDVILEFWVMPSALDESEPFSVTDIVRELNNTIYRIEENKSGDAPEDKKYVDDAAVNNALKAVGMEKASLAFTQIFIHYKKAGNDSGKAEYAIGIHIKNDSAKKFESDFKFLDIKEAYINVWQTDRQDILEQLRIWTPQQLEAKKQ